MLMKRILRFLPLQIDLCCTYLYDVSISVYNSMICDFIFGVFNYIMPVKSERFNTKIYIFERYSVLCASRIDINTFQFIHNEVSRKPVLEKK
jgi:hypothetical protein